MKKTVCMLISLTLTIAAYAQKEVSGEVFIVTKGGSSVKLGLVNVYFFTPTQYTEGRNIFSSEYRMLIERFNISDSLRLYNMCMEYARKDYDQEKELRELSKHTDVLSEARIKECQDIADGFRAAAQQNERLARAHPRFTTDTRADDVTIAKYIESHKREIITVKTNSDGKFTVKLKNQEYRVYALSSREVVNTEETYRWCFEYTPDNQPLYLSNDNFDQQKRGKWNFEK